MDILTLYILFCFCIFNVWSNSSPTRSYMNDYAWRDYKGIVPDDALHAGKDKLGKTMYIGQTLYENKLIPGKIYENDPRIYFEWYNKEIAQQQNIKILSTTKPNKFQWIPTESDKVMLLTNKILINGGYEDRYSVYLGRAFIDGETLVGKVVCEAENCLGLYTTSNGVAKRIQRFELLAYVSDESDSKQEYGRHSRN